MARHIVRLTAFQAVSQAIVIVTIPLVTRTYSPSVVGTAGALVSLLAIAGPVICLRLEQAILIERSDRMAAAATVVALLVAVAMASALSLAMILILGPWLTTQGLPFGTTIALLFVSLVLSGCCGILAQWSLRWHQLYQFGVGRASRPAVASLLSVLFPALGFGREPILIVLATTGGIVADLLINLRCKAGIPMRADGIRRQMATIARHAGLMSKSSPAILVNALSWNLPAIVLAVTLGPASAGAYSLGIRAVHLPLSAMASALSTILQQRYIVATSDQRSALVTRFLYLSFRLCLPPTAAAVVVGPTLAQIVLGKEWGLAGEYSRYLAIGIAAWFVSSPLSFVFNVHRAHGSELRSQIVILVLRVIALAGCLLSSANAVVACSLGVSMLLAYGNLLRESLAIARIRVVWRNVILTPLVVSAIGTIPLSALAVYAARYSSAASVTLIVFSVAVSWLALADAEIRSMLRK